MGSCPSSLASYPPVARPLEEGTREACQRADRGSRHAFPYRCLTVEVYGEDQVST